jgi:hypothetical protein
MSMTIVLPSELEERLIEESERRNLPASTLALQLLDQHLPSKDRHDNLIALIQSWIDSDDSEEQRETGEYLVRVLDEDRLSNRKLFPEDLKGVTW